MIRSIGGERFSRKHRFTILKESFNNENNRNTIRHSTLLLGREWLQSDLATANCNYNEKGPEVHHADL